MSSIAARVTLYLRRLVQIKCRISEQPVRQQHPRFIKNVFSSSTIIVLHDDGKSIQRGQTKTRLASVSVALRCQIITDEIDTNKRDMLWLNLQHLACTEFVKLTKKRYRLDARHHCITHDARITIAHGFARTMYRRVRVVSPPPLGSASRTSNCPSACKPLSS